VVLHSPLTQNDLVRDYTLGRSCRKCRLPPSPVAPESFATDRIDFGGEYILNLGGQDFQVAYSPLLQRRELLSWRTIRRRRGLPKMLACTWLALSTWIGLLAGSCTLEVLATSVVCGSPPSDEAWRAARFPSGPLLGKPQKLGAAKPRGDAAPFPEAGRLSDWELAVRVRAALWRNPELARFNLLVDVENGVATLSGPVPSEYTRSQAIDAVQQVGGIKAVRDFMRLRSIPTKKRTGPHPFPPVEQPTRPTRPASPAQPPQTFLRSHSGPSSFSRLLGQPHAGGPAVEPTPTWGPLGGAPSTAPSGGAIRPSIGRPEPELAIPNSQSVASTPPAAPTSSRSAPISDLVYSLEYLFQSNPRFRSIRAERGRDQVRLVGQVESRADLEDLRRAVSGLAGAEQLLLDGIMVRTHREP
jgi:hypothetical protein